MGAPTTNPYNLTNFGKANPYSQPKPATPLAMPGPHAWQAGPRKAPAGFSFGGGQAPAYGTESGPGILETWFGQRANGTDPAFEYAQKRGMTSLGNQYAATGGFNSGAARQGESDFNANLIAQREGQLDSLAGGASGEHQGRLNSMFQQGSALAGGQAGLAGQYDLGSANAMNSGNMAAIMMMLNKAGVDSKASQGFLNNIIGLGGAAAKLGA